MKLKKEQKKKIYKIIKEYLLLTLGSIIVIISVNMFFLPLSLIPGSTTAIGLIVNKFYQVPIWLTTFILNIAPVLVLMIFDKSNAAKTIFVIFVFGICMKITEPYANLLIEYSNNIDDVIKYRIHDLISCVIFGSVLLGYGVSIILNNGGTTGGTNTFSVLLHKLFKRPKLSTILLIVEGSIITSSTIVFKDFKVGFFCLLILYIAVLVLNKFTKKSINN